MAEWLDRPVLLEQIPGTAIWVDSGVMRQAPADRGGLLGLKANLFLVDR